MNTQSPARLAGSASIAFQTPVYISSCASVVGKKEGEGPLGDKFDLICEDPMFGCDTWEAAESTMQKEAASLALGKAGLAPGDIRMTFAGDLLAQTTASSFGIAGMGIPFYGLLVPALPWGNPFPWEPCPLPPDMESIFYAPPPAILPARKKNSAFLWLTVTSAPFLPLGR